MMVYADVQCVRAIQTASCLLYGRAHMHTRSGSDCLYGMGAQRNRRHVTMLYNKLYYWLTRGSVRRQLWRAITRNLFDIYRTFVPFVCHRKNKTTCVENSSLSFAFCSHLVSCIYLIGWCLCVCVVRPSVLLIWCACLRVRKYMNEYVFVWPSSSNTAAIRCHDGWWHIGPRRVRHTNYGVQSGYLCVSFLVDDGKKTTVPCGNDE